MQVASLELCKELYEVSGWETGAWKFWRPILGQPVTSEKADVSKEMASIKVPSYDAGFLLRKLPSELSDGFGISLHMNVARTKWLCGYHKHDDAVADTPEDALASLAINLFKQGVLTKSQEDK